MYSGVRLSGRSHSPLSDYYAWEFPGAPARVHLRLDVVREIERQLQWQYQYDPETQLFGVLLGRAVPHGAIIIDDFERVETGDSDERLKAVTAKWAAKADPNLGIVGYYRGQAKDGFALTNEDLILIRNQFALPLTVVMLIKPSSTSMATGGFFFALNGEAKSRFSFGRFPFDRDQLATEKPAQVQTGEATPQLLAVPPNGEPGMSLAPAKRLEQATVEDTASMRPATVPALPLPQVVQTLINAPKAQPRDRAWMWFASAAALAVLALGVELYQWTQSPATAVALEASRTASGGLQVNWNKKARIFNGDGALLSIQEGNYKKQIYLDLPKLRTGYLLYYPRTGSQVILRMEVLLRGGQETAMVSTMVGEARGSLGQRPREPAGGPTPGDGTALASMEPGAPSSPVGSGSAVVVLEPPDPGAVVEIPGAVQEIPVNSATHAITLAGAPAPIAPENLASLSFSGSSSAPSSAPSSSEKDAQVVKLDAGNTPVEPRVLHSVMPVPPQDNKLWTGYPVLIDVLVQIDSQGKVRSAVARNSRTASGNLLAKLAVDAAQQWQFEPAYVGNQKIASEMLLRFRF